MGGVDGARWGRGYGALGHALTMVGPEDNEREGEDGERESREAHTARASLRACQVRGERGASRMPQMLAAERGSRGARVRQSSMGARAGGVGSARSAWLRRRGGRAHARPSLARLRRRMRRRQSE